METLTEIYELPAEGIYQKLGSSTAGLADEDIARLLAEYGANELEEGRKTPIVLRLAANFYHTFALLLWVAGALAFIAGLPQLGWAIIAVIFINAVFSFWQEFQAERAVEALKRILPAKATVIRSGEMKQVLARDLVPGDVIVLQEGDNISADARLVEDSELRVNAATLTGESQPVRKTAGQSTGRNMNPSEIPNLVLAGTSVAFGTGKAVVFSTGMNTEFGKIAAMTQRVKPELSPLQKEVNRVALIIAAVALTMGAVLFGVAALLTPLSISVAAIFAIGMIVANVPEGLLPTVTLSLAMAVKRMVKKNALVKKLSGVETLGSTTVICTDKTGTLTQNEMTVRELWAGGMSVEVEGNGYEPQGRFLSGGAELDEVERSSLEPLMRIAAVCNNSRLIPPDHEGQRWGIVGDPTEAALLVASRKWGFEEEGVIRTHELPFDSRRKRMSVLAPAGAAERDVFPGSGSVAEEGMAIAYVKGAPREVLSLCPRILEAGEVVPLTPEKSGEIIARNDEMARMGLRVLAMAYRFVGRGEPVTMEEVERELVFVGLMAMMDPPRPEVAEAVGRCGDAGIRVIMITGDYGLTAESVARRIGLLGEGPARIVNGADLEQMDERSLTEALESPGVLFARVSPEHKMRIAGCLRQAGEVVAMTGDGVNDAPALKKADIGVAMGIAGTDVAKEAATIILTDDNFATIVRAVEEGRVVYDNMRKFLAYIFAHLTPEIIPFVAFVLFDVPLGITVMQILAIDLGTETLPALALGVEKGEPDIMDRKPRSRRERLVDRQMLLRAWIFLGSIEAVLVMAGYFWVLYSNGWQWGEQLEESSHVYVQATTMTFAGIVALQLGTAFACRTNRASAFHIGFFSNRWLLWGVFFEVVLTLLIVYLPPLQSLFQTTGLEWKHWLFLAWFPPVIFFSDELRKAVIRRFSGGEKGGNR
ncbi:MAG: cation-transporting P-type ATPase [Pseudomonadota bacterium]